MKGVLVLLLGACSLVAVTKAQELELLQPTSDVENPLVHDAANVDESINRNRWLLAVGWGFVLLYSFYAIASSCDEYFVPAVEVFCDKFKIPGDVAGATLLAMGSGSPELTTNVISIFVTKSPVGVGTIVGSEIFNMLVITGTSAIAALGGTLHIAWRPFVRDVVFYAISLCMLWWALLDNRIVMSEGIVLVSSYAAYVLVCVKFSSLSKVICPKRGKSKHHKTHIGDVEIDEDSDDIDEPLPGELSASPDPFMSSPVTPMERLLTEGQLEAQQSFVMNAGLPLLPSAQSCVLHSNLMRHFALSGWLLTREVQVSHDRAERICRGWWHMWFHLDPIHKELIFSDGPLHRINHVVDGVDHPTSETSGTHLRRFWSDLGFRNRYRGREKLQDSARRRVLRKIPLLGCRIMASSHEKELRDCDNDLTDFMLVESSGKSRKFRAHSPQVKRRWMIALQHTGAVVDVEGSTTVAPADLQTLSSPEEGSLVDWSPLVESEPDEKIVRRSVFYSCLRGIFLVLKFPLKTVLMLTVPDVRKPKREKFFFFTFLFSVTWLAVFSYVMVTAAENLADCLDIPKEIVGLTVAAAGTSFPNVMASVIVARRGLGPMAVANAYGANIFNIFCALGIPWLFAAGTMPGGYVIQASNIMGTVIFLLVSLLAMVVLTLICRMRVGAKMGWMLCVAYAVYLVYVGVQAVRG